MAQKRFEDLSVYDEKIQPVKDVPKLLLKLIKRNKLDRLHEVKDLLVIPFEGILGSFMCCQNEGKPNTKTLLVRTGIHTSLCDLYTKAKIAILVDPKTKTEKELILKSTASLQIDYVFKIKGQFYDADIL